MDGRRSESESFSLSVSFNDVRVDDKMNSVDFPLYEWNLARSISWRRCRAGRGTDFEETAATIDSPLPLSIDFIRKSDFDKVLRFRFRAGRVDFV
jgi:hypothetical protein